MKTIKYMKFNRIFLFLSVIMVISSCDTTTDLEDPLKGKITLITDWSKRTEGVSIPTDYKVLINSQTLNYTETSNLLPELEAGTYPIYVYNNPDNITVNGTTATVATAGNTVAAQLGWLFTSITEVQYADFKVETITAVMQQQVRQLKIELTITEDNPERIASTTATLSGVANVLDFKTNTYSGANLLVSPAFIRNDNKLTTIVRLLGISGESQKLTLDVTFTDSRTQRIESDLSGLLFGFNTDKHVPLNLSADLNTPVGAGFTATITEWKSVPDSDGIAW